MHTELHQLQQEVEAAWQKLALDQKIQEIAVLEAEVAEPDIWIQP